VANPSTNELSVTSSALQMVPQTDPGSAMNPRWSFEAIAAASDGRFCGSYYDSGVHMLTLSVQTSCSAQMDVELVNDTDLIIYQASLPVSPGSENFQIPVDAEHFTPSLFINGSFEDLLRNVERVWITFEWDKTIESPVFAIDNVQLLGAGAGYGEWIDGVSGLTFTQKLAASDNDGDGLSNANEFNMDSLPNTPNPPFSVSVAGNAMEWISSTNCIYTVLRATNLVSQAFVPVQEMDGSGTVMRFIDPDEPSKAFYKINVRRK